MMTSFSAAMCLTYSSQAEDGYESGRIVTAGLAASAVSEVSALVYLLTAKAVSPAFRYGVERTAPRVRRAARVQCFADDPRALPAARRPENTQPPSSRHRSPAAPPPPPGSGRRSSRSARDR